MDLTGLDYWLLLGLTALNYVSIAILIVWIVLQRRESQATLAWIFFVLLVPFVGVLAFWLLGANRLRLRRWRRRQAGEDLESRIQPLSCAEDEIEPDDCPFPAERGLLRLARRLDGMAAQPGNAVTIFRDGPGTFDALLQAIDGAKHHLHLLYYIWSADTTGARIRDALTRAAGRGVEVRVLVDDVGSLYTPASFFDSLRDAGGAVDRFLPMGRVGRHLSLNHRNHRKIVVSDGRVGFTGGMNIGDEYAGLLGPWYDAHVRVEGPAVHRLQEIFCQDWYHTTQEDLALPSYFPPLEPNPGGSWAQFVASGPSDGRWHAIHTAIFAAISGARKRVWLETPYFVPDKAVALALGSAALRGVDVRVLLPGRSDHRLVLWAGRSYYSDLLAAGVRIFEVPRGFLHAKTVTIDGVVATVGSANLDQRSFRLNFEANAFFYGPEVAGALEADFSSRQEEAQEVGLEAHRARGRLARLQEAFARLVGPVL